MSVLGDGWKDDGRWDKSDRPRPWVVTSYVLSFVLVFVMGAFWSATDGPKRSPEASCFFHMMEFTALKACYEKVGCHLTKDEVATLDEHHKQSVLQCERYIFINSLSVGLVPDAPSEGT